MAYDNEDDNELTPGLASYLSPLMTSKVDVDAALASGNPMQYLAAARSGAPMPQVTAGANPPAPSTLAQNAPQPLTPATNAPNPPSEATRTPAVPATVTPTGTAQPAPAGAQWSQLARNATQQAHQSLTDAATLSGQRTPVDANALEARRAALASPQSDSNPTGVPNPMDPNHPEYRPSAGRRIARGVLGAVAGLAGGGIRGAVLGAIEPQATTGVGYKSPTRPFSLAASRNAQALSSLDQQIQQADTQAKTKDQAVQNKIAIAAGFAGIGKEAAANLTAEAKSGQLDATLAKAGMKAIRDQDGKVVDIQDDPDSQVYKGREVLNNLREAQQEKAEADAALKTAQNDPTSPAFKLAQQRAATAAANATAAQTRASAYMLNATAGNLGVDTQGNQIAGSVTNAEGAPVGSRFASTYIKQEGKVAQFNDVSGALDNLERSARAMVAKGQKPDNALVAAALAQPAGTATQWVQGQVAKGNLTPEQRDYVTNLVAAHENIQALRQSAGGGVSDAQVNRLVEMLPNASTPDLDYFLRQTGQIRQTAARLAEGVPQTEGGHAVESPAASSGPPQSVVDSAKEGQYIHGPNGEVFKKVNGKAVKQ